VGRRVIFRRRGGVRLTAAVWVMAKRWCEERMHYGRNSVNGTALQLLKRQPRPKRSSTVRVTE